ncbi:MAG TPA: class I SAM-dependent methyltransferase [Chloroflexota bacterium]|jgi:tRNA (cmo5U34)-methyltransferase
MEGHDHRGHDWQSATYAAAWVADAEARDPERIEQLELLVKLLPQPRDAPIRVLDLGAGYGILTRLVLATFPRARVTLFDISQAMLDQAKPRLAAHLDQLDWAIGDLTRPNWVRAVSGPYDAVVSAATLHNMEEGGLIAAIYAQLAPLLAPGGAFLCYDHMSAGGPRIEQQFDVVRPVRRPDAVEADGHGHGVDGHGHGTAATITAPAGVRRVRFPGTIEAHLGWLRAAGFDEVDCFWKSFHQAIYGGYLR